MYTVHTGTLIPKCSYFCTYISLPLDDTPNVLTVVIEFLPAELKSRFLQMRELDEDVQSNYFVMNHYRN